MHRLSGLPYSTWRSAPGMHSRQHNDEVQFYAFDVLMSDGDDLRKPPPACGSEPRAVLARRVDGIFLSDFERGEIGPDLFRHACLFGLGGIGLQRKIGPIGGRFTALGEGEEPAHPAMARMQDAFR